MVKVSTFLLLMIGAAFFSSSTQASCSFRVQSGELVRCGMTQLEIRAYLGHPDNVSTTSIGVNARYRQRRQTLRTWSYIIESDIGGQFLVNVYFDGDKVVDIKKKQSRRLSN